MEIGALDEYDVFRDPNIKYVIATEDAHSDSNKLLSLILQASGFSKDSFVILPYEGCSKIESAVYVSKCLKRFRSDLAIIIHRDRDGMCQGEVDDFKARIEQEDNACCFVTKYNDLEMYFCTISHIQKVLEDNAIDMSAEIAQDIFNAALESIREKALERFLNRRLDPMREGGRGASALESQRYFETYLLQCLNGHLMLGAVKSILHERYHISGTDILKLSDTIRDDSLCAILR